MALLPEDYKNSICEVKNLRNDLLAVGRIYTIGDDDIECASAEDDKMPILPYNTPVKLYIFNNRMGFKILGGTVFISTDAFLRVSDIQTLQDFERRGYFRLNVKNPTNIYLIDKETNELDPEPFSVMLEDVSLSGLRFSSDQYFSMGTKFSVEVHLVKRRMLFSAEIVRQAPSNDGRKHYGCAYFNQTERQIDDLCYDIFQLQRVEMRKRAERR